VFQEDSHNQSELNKSTCPELCQTCVKTLSDFAIGVSFRAKSRCPQVIVNKQKWKEAVERLELSRELAKQVLSQLSYTPTMTLSFYGIFGPALS
jgi:hypothetical protein